ncbi:MAG: hypothetical protein H0W74_03615 [Sphingosinicella sp.]|nr:hypothetical protein [Sphingosinicella sp.]
MNEDFDFFMRRAQEERRAAITAPDPAAAAAHVRLADQNEALVASYALLENPLGTQPVPGRRKPARKPPLAQKSRRR